MVVVRFKMQCQPDKAKGVRAALERVVAPSRATDGVLSFDIAQDLTDENSFIATEVFQDRDALSRQEALPEVTTVLALLEDALTVPPEATIYEVSSSAPWGD